MRTRIAAASLALLFTAALFTRTPSVRAAHAAVPSWNQPAAAHFLDARELWWQAWPRTQKDHGTLCISCHTVVPYAMVRPALSRDLGDAALTPPEQIMLGSVEKRVTQWSDMTPFYLDAKYGAGKTAESHATEAVLNAVILASYDAAQDRLRQVTRTAFDHAWELQESSGPLAGAWKWQDFHLGPWESTESGYQGAALLYLEALNLPGEFAREPGTQPHLAALRDYLRRNYAAQPLLNQLYILWASAKDPALLTRSERQSLFATLHAQRQSDGGFRLASLDPRNRLDHTPQASASDGYATGLVSLALEANHTSLRDPTLAAALDWLTHHQQPDGSWIAASLNKQRDPASDPALFMTDAATAYAALALEHQP
jgi:squalene-hopene/tetraprenyl-beta-curcumene cyclase